MEYRRVESSNIRDIGYDESTLELRVIFKSGTEYSYKGVPPNVWKQFVNSPSKGQHFAAHIKGTYDHTVVDE